MIKWNNELTLFTIEEFSKIPNGIEFVSINGHTAIKGKDTICMDTLYGHMEYGVLNVHRHQESELFLTFMLSQ